MLIGRTGELRVEPHVRRTRRVRDVYAEELCEPPQGTPMRDSKQLREGPLRRDGDFNAGTLGDTPLIYQKTVMAACSRPRPGRR